jgi:ribosomal protein L34
MGTLIVGIIGLAISLGTGAYSINQNKENAAKQEAAVNSQTKRTGEDAKGTMTRMATQAGRSFLALRGSKLKNRAVRAYGNAQHAAQATQVANNAATTKSTGAIFKA